MDASAHVAVPASISAPSSDGPGVATDPATRERALVASARDGDREAFEQLYRTHVAAIARHVRLRLGRTDEDVVAEVFLRAWRGIESYRDTGVAFGAWLHGIARHVVVDEFRARSRSLPVAEVPEVAVEPRTADLLALRDAIERLSSQHRQVIEMKYLTGLTNDEVAAALGTTPSAVNSMQWRALRALREGLEER